MKTRAWRFRLILVGTALVSWLVGFIAFPGCATPSSSPSASVPESPQHQFYDSAMRLLEKKKNRGELPGLEPTTAGTFSGTWLWFDNTKRTGDHRLRATFTSSDGRPEKRFEMVYSEGWQLVPSSKN